MIHRKLITTALVTLLVTSAGCTVVYDSDAFLRDGGAGKPDAEPDAFNPSALHLDSIAPEHVFEGQGASDMARALPIVLAGESIAPDAHIVFGGGGLDQDLPATVSSDGTLAAVALRVPVDTTLATGESAMVSVTLRQAGDVEDSRTLTVDGLSELIATAGNLSIDALDTRYSTIEIDDDVTLLGDSPARFVATDSIVVSGALHADGRGDGQRSAGGFLGGLAGQPGDGPGGGGRGQNQSGGGGAGNLSTGQPGQGNDGGEGGTASTANRLTPLSAGVGGGGGGGGVPLLGSGGAGGAGGGAIELTAGGPLTITSTGVLSADGAVGENTAACATSGGAGGGGAGGALFLRSESIVQIADGARLSVQPGAGGSAPGNCQGGNGSAGQLRADAPAVSGSLGTPLQGPIWDVEDTPAIVTTNPSMATLHGDVGATYFVSINGETPESVTLSTSAAVSLDLQPGLNQVCALVDASANLGQPESLNCVSIAFIPQS